jgi:anti-sigma regulatory factor (Ser/Thr protein kinase)
MESLRQPSHECFTVSDEADVGAVRRAVGGQAARLGADDAGRGRAELVATELATNLLRHARPGGWVLTRPLPPHHVETIAVDTGPGITGVATVLEGHNGSSGGLGCGLAAVRRASARFDIHSRDGVGTVVLAVIEVRAGVDRGPPPTDLWGGVSVGVAGPCGDGWAVIRDGDHLAVAVVDGLGHGPRASAAADATLAAFAADPTDLKGFIARANEATRSTRGAAVTACILRPEAGEVSHVGVGNVSARLYWPGRDRGLASIGGTVGTQANPPRATVTTVDWPEGGRLVVWTDGLTTRLDLADDPDLLVHDPAVAAAVLHRRHTRGRDDATVVVVADPRPP